MTPHDLDAELRKALRESSQEASVDFTRGVLSRLDRRGGRPPIPRTALAAAALVLLVLVVAAGLRSDRPGRVSKQAAERQRLLDEYRALEMELEQIRHLANERTPVLYLGGDESLDVVYELAASQVGSRADEVRSAALPDRG